MVPVMAPKPSHLQSVLCPKCARPVAWYFEEIDGFPHVFPLVGCCAVDVHAVDVSAFGLPKGFWELTGTLVCSCGATPSYSTFRVAAQAREARDVKPPGLRPRRPRRIRLPS